MAEYNLGTAHGVVEISSNTAGLASAGRDLDAIKAKGESTHASLQKLGTGMLVAGGIIAAGLGIAVKTASDFESKLSAISAVSGATADEMQKIRDKALQLGKDTKYSAGEAASAMEELSKAGISTTNILGGAADATVALAAAGEVDLPFAATVASNAMNQFNLSAADMVGVVDSIAGAANASAIDVSDFGMSLSQVGAVANLAGLSFGDTAIAIAEMGNAGIKGSDAGTSLKSMLMRLQPQTTAQAEEMRKLGIITADGSNKFYDQAGNLKSLRGIQDILGKSLEGMSKQQKQATLQTIFGSDAIRAAAIFSNEGAKGYDKMNEAIGKTSAAEIAAKRMDNFAGSLEQLKGSAETLGIQIGTVLMPILRNIIDRVRGIVDIFIGMNDTVKTVMVVIAMLVGSLLLLGGGLIKAHQFFGNFMDALRAGRAVMTTVIERIQSMAVSIRAQIVQIRAAATAQMQAAAQSGFFATAATLAATGVRTLALAIRTVITTLGPIGLAFGAAAAAAAFFTGKSDDGMESTQAWTQALYDQNGALAANARALIAKGVAENSAFANLKQFGLTYGQVSAALAGDAKMMDYVTKKFNAAIAAGAGDAAANVQNWNFQTTSALDLRNAAIAALAALNDTNGAIGEAGVIAANTAAGLAGMDKIMGKVPKTTVDATRAYNNVSDAVKKHLETLKTAASASEQRLSEWVQRQKNKLDAAMARWNSYRDTVMSALTGNVKIGDAWGKTQDQAKAAKDAAKELADAKAVLAQEEANAATDAARNAAKNRVEAEIKAEADARQFASIADPVDRAKAIAAAQLDATIKANEEARKAAVESQYASDPLASAKAAVAAAEVAAASASAAAQTFDQNFAAQVADSTLFGTMFDSASNALTAQFGANSPIWTMLRGQLLAMGPGEGTALAQYIAEHGLTPEMEAQLKEWQPWTEDVATEQATKAEGAGVDIALAAMAGINKKLKEEEDQLIKMGASMANGILKGFREKKKDFADAVQAYVDAANKQLDIHSPSRVFQTIGQQTAAGFVLGLRDGLPAVENIFSQMSRGVNVGVSTVGMDSFGGLAPIAATFAAGGDAAGPGNLTINARVFVGDREITDIVRTEINVADDAALAYVLGGVG